ncbi:MAG: hypothetical protein ACD_60C00137G0007 [uncultured bacterium]|nr:MAG: hypothetical protein ACD_60C00137G0007 [uncultured bacterium]
MVKIPGLDELKKMGSDLMDSAKTVKLGGMVDKVKAGIESVGKKTEPLSGDDPLHQVLSDIRATLNELNTLETTRAALIKKLERQVNSIIKAAEGYQKPISTVSAEPKDDESK